MTYKYKIQTIKDETRMSHYFDTEVEMKKALEKFHAEKYLMRYIGKIVPNMRTVFVGTFEVDGREYVLHEDFEYEYPEEMAIRQFVEGVYANSYNRWSLLMNEYSNIDWDGECEIVLKNYHFEYIE